MLVGTGGYMCHLKISPSICSSWHLQLGMCFHSPPVGGQAFHKIDATFFQTCHLPSPWWHKIRDMIPYTPLLSRGVNQQADPRPIVPRLWVRWRKVCHLGRTRWAYTYCLGLLYWVKQVRSKFCLEDAVQKEIKCSPEPHRLICSGHVWPLFEANP